jgi:hypothetical protein
MEAEMNIDQAISSHVGRKSKLGVYVNHPNRSLNVIEIGRDDGCDLDKWLPGEGQKCAKLPEFAKLVADHTHFHVAAANIVKRAGAGQKMSEEIAFGVKSEYAAASNAVVTALMKMKSVA